MGTETPAQTPDNEATVGRGADVTQPEAEDSRENTQKTQLPPQIAALPLQDLVRPEIVAIASPAVASLAPSQAPTPQAPRAPSRVLAFQRLLQKRRIERVLSQNLDTSRGRLNAEELIEVFRVLRKNWGEPFLTRAVRQVTYVDGESSSTRVICVYFAQALLLLLLAFVAQFFIAWLVFAQQRYVAVDSGSGALVQASAPQLVAAASASVSLQPLWRFPQMQLSELRRVDHVGFSYQQVVHTIRVTAVARTPAGTVLLRGEDGSSLRVEAGGRSFWAANGWPEVLLPPGSSDSWPYCDLREQNIVASTSPSNPR